MLFDGLVVPWLAAPGDDLVDRLLLFRLVAGPRQFLFVQNERHRVRERERLVAAVADVLARASYEEKRLSEIRRKKGYDATGPRCSERSAKIRRRTPPPSCCCGSCRT